MVKFFKISSIKDNKTWYEALVNTDIDFVSVIKRWDTGPDPRDGIMSTIGFTKEDFLNVMMTISEFLANEIRQRMEDDEK